MSTLYAFLAGTAAMGGISSLVLFSDAAMGAIGFILALACLFVSKGYEV